MKEKSELISKLRNAQTQHERWMSYAEAIYNGIKIGEEQTPMLHTDCEFGKWLSANGQLLFIIDAPKSIQEDHKVLHSVYMQLYKIMHESSDTNIFNKSRIERKKKEELDKNFKVLKSISSNLIKELDRLVEKLNGMTDEQVQSLK